MNFLQRREFVNLSRLLQRFLLNEIWRKRYQMVCRLIWFKNLIFTASKFGNWNSWRLEVDVILWASVCICVTFFKHSEKIKNHLVCLLVSFSTFRYFSHTKVCKTFHKNCSFKKGPIFTNWCGKQAWMTESGAQKCAPKMAQYFCKRPRSWFRFKKFDPESGSFLTERSC